MVDGAIEHMKHWIHRLLFLFGVSALTFLLGCSKERVSGDEVGKSASVSKPSVSAKPKIVALEEKHAFGQVKQGKRLEHVFRIRNKGDAELVIERASGS